MTQRISQVVKDKALALYLSGFTVTKISETLGYNYSTIQSWRDSGGWDDLKKSVTLATQDYIGEDVTKLITKDTEKHLNMYRTLGERGMEELVDKTARSAGEAGEMVDKGVKGEREIAKGLVSFKLLNDIARIIAEEVSDDSVKKRIAARLRGLLTV